MVSVALLTWPRSTCVEELRSTGGGSVLIPGLISFWAKKASTTTMRMGKAALLKNLLTAKKSLRKG